MLISGPLGKKIRKEIMKLFKKFLADIKASNTKYEWFTFTVDEYQINILFESSTQGFLNEAKR